MVFGHSGRPPSVLTGRVLQRDTFYSAFVGKTLYGDQGVASFKPRKVQRGARFPQQPHPSL